MKSTGALRAGGSGSIDFVLKSEIGGGLAGDLKAIVASNVDAPLLEYPREIAIGDLDAGESRSVTVPIKAQDNLKDGQATFTISFEETNHNPPDDFQVKVPTRRMRVPHFEILKSEMDDSTPDGKDRLAFGNGNGVWQPGESVELYVTLANTGEGDAQDVAANLVGDDGANLRVLELGQFMRKHEAKDLARKETRRLAFALSLSRLHKSEGDLPLALEISEKRGRFNISLPLKIRAGQRIAKPQSVLISASDETTKRELPTSGKELHSIPPYVTPERPSAFAILVGISDYRSVSGVPYATNDADLVKDYFINALRIPEANIKILKDRWATKADIESALEVWLPNQIRIKGNAKSQVYVYFSGHGSPRPESGEAFLLPYDGDPSNLDTAGYSLGKLYQTLSNLSIQGALVVLDSCFSGAGGPRTLLAKGTRPLIAAKEEGLPGNGRLVVLSAATGSQISGDYEEKQHGLLTYYFLRGLQEQTGATPNKSLMLRDLYDYLHRNVTKQARADNRDQEPQIRPGRSLGPWESEPLASMK